MTNESSSSNNYQNLTARQRDWFAKGQRDYARGAYLSFDNAPDYWSDLELLEAQEFYAAGFYWHVHRTPRVASVAAPEDAPLFS